jgi:hypothetical protein
MRRVDDSGESLSQWGRIFDNFRMLRKVGK